MCGSLYIPGVLSTLTPPSGKQAWPLSRSPNTPITHYPWCTSSTSNEYWYSNWSQKTQWEAYISNILSTLWAFPLSLVSKKRLYSECCSGRNGLHWASLVWVNWNGKICWPNCFSAWIEDFVLYNCPGPGLSSIFCFMIQFVEQRHGGQWYKGFVLEVILVLC